MGVFFFVIYVANIKISIIFVTEIKTMKKTPTNPKGAGRPKGVETTTIRVPLCLKEIIQRFINKKLNKKL